MSNDDYTMAEFWADVKPEMKARRKAARSSAHERIKDFFVRNDINFEEGQNTLIFRTPSGTVCYYPPSQKMQHKDKVQNISPTGCMKYVKALRE